MNSRRENKKDIVFKGRGAAVQAHFCGSQPPAVSDVIRDFRDAGAIVTQGRPVIFDFGDVLVTREWLFGLLRDLVFPQKLSVSQWKASNAETAEVLASLGLKTESERPVVTQGTLKILRAPLRSGQSYHQEGDVLMLGNLHDGAEITATGSIIVMGELKGMVHAGCLGDDTATVVTLSYRTNQLRIGTLVSNVVDPKACSWWRHPVCMSIENGVFVAREIKTDEKRS